MRVIIIAKTTNYERFSKRLKHLANTDVERRALEQENKEHTDCLNKLQDQLTFHQINYTLAHRDTISSIENCDLVITVGGDGTLLSSSHLIEKSHPKLRIIGVKSSSLSVGYLCSFTYKNIHTLIDSLVNKKIHYHVVQRLKAIVERVDNNQKQISVPCLNDILFCNTNPALTSRYKIHAENKEEIHRSSGIWFATAIGSTAGIFAAGGTPVKYDRKDFQYRVRELFRHGEIDAFELSGGFFDPDREDFLITNFCESALLALDGQHGIVNLQFGDRFSLQRAEPLNIYLPR